jgi:hypothetical protein
MQKPPLDPDVADEAPSAIVVRSTSTIWLSEWRASICLKWANASVGFPAIASVFRHYLFLASGLKFLSRGLETN